MPLGKKTPNVDAKSPQIRVANSAFAKILFHKATKSIGIIFASILILYVCFAATIIRVVPTTTTGFVPVKNLTFEGGKVPVGREILVDVANVQGTQIVDRLKQSFLPNSSAAMVEVLGGPVGKLTWAPPDILAIDGTPVKAPMPAIDGKSPIGENEENWFLKKAYAAKCVSGACNVGEVIIISADNVIGVPLFSDTISQNEGND